MLSSVDFVVLSDVEWCCRSYMNEGIEWWWVQNAACTTNGVVSVGVSGKGGEKDPYQS